MDPSRKRKIRLVLALSAAVLLAVALIYTSFSAATEAKEPSQIMAAGATGGTYEMTGEVVRGSVRHHGSKGIAFFVTDRKGESEKMPVTYKGAVPDPFRGGREIVLEGSMEDGTFVGKPETLITKCPSKFTTQSSG